MMKLGQAGRLGAFVEETEIHGIQKAFGGRSALRRGFWLVTFAVATFAMCYFLYKGFVDYGSSRLTTETSLIVSDEIPYPTLTVCSINEMDLNRQKVSHTARLWDLADKYGFTDFEALKEICLNDTAREKITSHPDVPLLIRNFGKYGGCELMMGQAPGLKRIGDLYGRIKGSFLTLDKVLDITLYPVQVSKEAVQQAFGTLESTYNTLAKAFPGPVPTTHDVKKVIQDSVGSGISFAQDFSTNILKAPGSLLEGVKRIGKGRRRREALSIINKKTSQLVKRKYLAYGKYIREVTKNMNFSTYSPHRFQNWRKKRGIIRDNIMNLEKQIENARAAADIFGQSVINDLNTLMNVTSFDMHNIIDSCEWIDNTGTIYDCTSSIKQRLFVGFGKCFSINDIVGEKRFNGNAMVSQIRVTLTQLPMARSILFGFVEMAPDYSYRAYISIPGTALPENENDMYRIKEDDVHIFNVENFNDVSMVSTEESPCLIEDEYGHQYHRENCMRDCIRLELRKALGCWLYDTEQYLMDRHKNSFQDSDRTILEEEDLSDAGSICDRNDTTDAIEMRSKLAICSTAQRCPLACHYESFDVEHVISRRRTEEVFRNVTDNTTRTVLTVRQKRTTMNRQRQVLAFSFFNLLAEVGGNMGLCIGASLLTLCHIFEFVVDLIGSGLSGLRSRRSKNGAVGATESGKDDTMEQPKKSSEMSSKRV